MSVNVTLQYRNSLLCLRPYDLPNMIFDRSASEVNRKFRKLGLVKMEAHVIQSKQRKTKYFHDNDIKIR